MTEFGWKYFGRMTDPDGAAYTKGVCGDEIEFFIIVENNIIENIKFYTEGCEHTQLCGETTASIVVGSSVDEAMFLSPKMVQEKIPDLPADHLHCSILCVITFLKALADYLYGRDL